MMRTSIEMNEERMCVTGAGGFLASWVVKFLLSKGYAVHATVRDPNAENCAHLKNLENAAENLHLFKADLLDYNSLYVAITACRGVFHVASPVPSAPVTNPKVELFEPALNGTCNVLKACTKAKVKRVVVVSSIGAVMLNPNWPTDQRMDELSWSDEEYCKTIEDWYCLSKTEAESKAWEYAKKNGLDLVTICPSLIIGPMLQFTVNASSLFLIKILKDGINSDQRMVDVRDVARAILLSYEKPEAEGRYICSAYMAKTQGLVDKLKTMYPKYKCPKRITEAEDQPKMNCEKLQKLGWEYITLEESLADSVKCYQEKSIFDCLAGEKSF
ncbi:hypothetical protein C5167_018025 [Papaver somniferum]|uniref:NAD-dependent epimerase/dehydratase domain-containing protein n=1 Tax=Papaver somniferum TaxID=3469 RepID=A0A4Y7IL23_PAPSO|nr:cinnamoyl-CoA reductase 2-like [Papaver somniferum]RZC49594.1 hypothetical protein C5167_018025 [Papaver somniferum]